MSFKTEVEAFRDSGMTRDTMIATIEKVYNVRRVNGFEVVDGWTMPDPPAPGLVAHIMGHGGDGTEAYWSMVWPVNWRDMTKGERFKYRADRKATRLSERGDEFYALTEPDGYSECIAAFVELGFAEGF